MTKPLSVEERARLVRGMELLREDMEECEPSELPAKKREYLALLASLHTQEP